MFNKGGISAIVATVLIILITVAAITIIWVAIIPMIQNSFGKINTDVSLRIVSSEGYTVWDNKSRLGIVQVERGSDEADLIGLNFIFSFGGNSVSHYSGDVPGVNNQKIYYINLTDYPSDLSSISIAPVFRGGKVGSVLHKLEGDDIAEVDIQALIDLGKVPAGSFERPNGGYDPHLFSTGEEPDCTDTCASLGHSCGVQDVCGVSVDCGMCVIGECDDLGDHDFYVDGDSLCGACDNSNSGAIDEPWCTLQYGVNQLVAGDTLYVKQGIYREEVSIGSGISGTVGNRITIRNYPGETPMIDGSKIVTGWQQCTDTTCDDLKVNGIINSNYNNIYWAEVDESDIDDPDYLMLFEQGEFAFIAQEPDQSSSANQNIVEFYDVPTINQNNKDALIDTIFTEDDDYWNGAEIWVHGYTNNIFKKKIADFVSSENKFVFDTPLTYILRDQDSYTLINHPHILDSPGEYYYSKIPVGGKYKVYFWPENVGNLAGDISVGVLRTAFRIDGSYITLDGFEITKLTADIDYIYGAGILTPAGVNHDENIIRNLKIHDSVIKHAINVNSGTDDIFENNSVYNIKEGRGIYSGYALRPIIRNNSVMNTGLTSIFYQETDYGQIIDNYVGSAGVHGNGISAYLNSNNILIARNIVLGANFASSIQASENITFYNNIFQGDDDGIHSNGAITGYVNVLNNVLYKNDTCDFDCSFSLYKGDTGDWNVINNIIEGYGAAGQPPTEEDWGIHIHNIYNAYSFQQGRVYDTYHFGIDETEPYFPDESQIFVSPYSFNFHLRPDSIAIDNGTDVSSYFPIEHFPNFDFTKDMEGNLRSNGQWDIGPYEY